jgi:hypothetical protein
MGEDRTARLILITGLAAGAVLVTAWASLPVPTLIRWIPDDSFYYFQPASMMAKGYVPSFDGRNAGNGFHPLWMFIITPIFALKKVDANLPIHLALALAGALYVFSAFNIYRILKALGVNAIFSAYGAATFLLWPSGITTAVDGEVTPINILVLSFLILTFIKLLKLEEPTTKDFVCAGFVGGLALVARNDNVFFLLLLSAYCLLRIRPRQKLKAAAALLGPGAAMAGVWLAWNYAICGAALPTSIGAVSLMIHRKAFGATPATFATVKMSLAEIHRRLPDFFTYSPIKMGILFFYGAAALQAAKTSGEKRPAGEVMFLALIFGFLLFVLNAGLRWYLRIWHLGALFLINQILLWYGLYAILEHNRKRNLIAHIAAAAALAFFVVDGVYTAHKPYSPSQKEMLAGGKWAAEHADVRVGAFSGGIAAYYGAENVVCLDGNMSVAAFRALKEKKLYRFCKQQRIEFIMDYRDWIWKRYEAFWPPPLEPKLEVVSAELDDPTLELYDYGEYVLVRVK